MSPLKFIPASELFIPNVALNTPLVTEMFWISFQIDGAPEAVV